jgi:spore coat polysaccharide biosynthesis protein SpsF
MKTVAIVQARTTSTRLPGKVLADIEGKSMLARVLERVAAAESIDEVVVATTSNHVDDPIVEIATTAGHRWFRGDEHDVLGRYVGAARESEADAIVRVTSDCPLVDPYVIDLVTNELSRNRGSLDYASNVTTRTYPRGLDVEAFFRDTLERAHRLATTREEREHVTMVIYSSRAALFLRSEVVDAVDNSDLRWTVDHLADLEVVRDAYRALELSQNHRPYQEIVRWFRDNPSIGLRNSELQTWSPTNAVV